MTKEEKMSLQVFEIWTWRNVESIFRKVKVMNEELLGRVEEKRRVMSLRAARETGWDTVHGIYNVVAETLERLINGNQSRG